MQINRGDWLAAEKLAEAYDPEAMSDILVSRAQNALRAGDFTQFETLLLRAQKPQLLLQGYKVCQVCTRILNLCFNFWLFPLLSKGE